MPIRPTGLTGCAGEHFVAYRLSAMGYVVALTRSGSPSVDLMVGTPDGKKAVTIQVKTATEASYTHKRNPEKDYWTWRVGTKAKEPGGKPPFYAFVDLRAGEEEPSKFSKSKQAMPDVFIIPADEVANTCQKQEVSEGWFWRERKDMEKWHEAWDLIKKCLG
jgi:hypothetical protein